MTLLARLRSFMAGLLRSRRLDIEMNDEWQFHLDERADALVASGMARNDAERQARIEFGDPLRWKVEGREAHGLGWLHDLRSDLRDAFRQVSRAPGFTAVVVATLALGIGANTAIFSVLNAIYLRPLPYPHAERLVQAVGTSDSDGSESFGGISMAEIDAMRTRSQTLSHLGVYSFRAYMLSGPDGTLRMKGAPVTPALLDMLEVRPMLGRLFASGEEHAGADAVIVISHALWQNTFGSDPAILGTPLVIDGSPRTVVGVMPAGFRFLDSQPDAVDCWVPFVFPTGQMAHQQFMLPSGRLREGSTRAAATAELRNILTELRRTPGPDQVARGDGPARMSVVGIQELASAPLKPALRLLAIAAGFVLLIACLNVANLLLARSSTREREHAIRRALGAGSGRLIRQALTESLILAMLGGVAGTALALGGVQLLRVLGATLPRMDVSIGVGIPRLDEIGIDGSVLAFAFAVSLLTGLLFGVGPALRQSRTPSRERLGDRTTSSQSGFDLFRRHRMHGLLVVLEISLALMLFVGGGLLIRSFVNLTNVTPGFSAANVLSFQVSLPRRVSTTVRGWREQEAQHVTRFAEDLRARLRTIPGARAAYSQSLPTVQWLSITMLSLSPNLQWNMLPPPKPGVRLPANAPNVQVVSPDFLSTMGVSVADGRSLNEGDTAGQHRVVLINQTLAKSGFLGPHPVGRSVYALGYGDAPWEVVGVVDDVRQQLEQEPDPQIYLDARQWPDSDMPYFVLRTTGDPHLAIASIRDMTRSIDRQATVDNIATIEELVSNSVARPRLYSTLLGIFAAVAIALAGIGIYGIVAYAVVRRTREIGIRMALGAQRQQVLRLVLGQSAILTGIGVALGLAGAAAMSRYLQSLLFGVTPLDTTTFVAVAGCFAAIAAIAAALPARRAVRVDPTRALRCD